MSKCSVKVKKTWNKAVEVCTHFSVFLRQIVTGCSQIHVAAIMCSGCGHFSKKHVHVLMTLKQSRISSKFQCEVLMIHACVAIAALTTEMLQPW